MKPQPECPECEKLVKVSKESNIIGQFLDYFLSKKELHLARYVPISGAWVEDENDEEIYIREMLVPAREYCGDTGINRLLAEYFGVDLDKVEQERQALLDWLRESHNG